MYDLFASIGINDTILIDVLSRPPFASDVPRTGDYVGISARLKELIVISMKVAAGLSKPQA
jgi:alkylhydroperoxidase/carboxymuconolactone decarboxylase family protein YurZ